MTQQPIVTQYEKEDDYVPYYSFVYPNETGTPVEYHIKMECSSLDTINDLLVPTVTNLLNETIHQVVSTFYSTYRPGETLRFDITMIGFSDGKNWTLSSIPLQFANNMFELSVTSKNSYLKYKAENAIKDVTVNRFEQNFVDGSSIIIKVNMRQPVDGKYPVTYKYTKCVESTFEGIEQGCVDLLELHWKHVMIDSDEWAQIAGYKN